MGLPCRLHKSRHGVYRYRYQFTRSDGRRLERRYSLNTKDPVEAKEKSLLLSAMLVGIRKKMSNEIPMNQKDDSIAKLAEQIAEQAKQLEVVYEEDASGHRKVTMKADPTVPGDIEALLSHHDKVAKEFFDSELGQSFKKTAPESPTVIQSGMTIPEAIERFRTRQKAKLAPKSFYEYGLYQEKFKEWIKIKKKSENYPIGAIDRSDIADWIDDLLSEGITHSSIQNKYLRSASTLFEVAQSAGSYSQDKQLPTRGHKLFTKRDKKRASSGSGYKSFTADELKKIFDPVNYITQKTTPTDFWLPMLGLFTGGRLNELCQLLPNDIKNVGGIWSISITDENEKQSLKTIASKRIIPLHSRLIELGFLEFVEDMNRSGYEMLFPYLTANAFGNYSETPSERFGKYLDSVGIVDDQKVFHSFRSTSNNKLKQSGVAEETRCQFIGHEYDSVNSVTYAEEHTVAYLMEHAASKLDFDLTFEKLHYPKEQLIKVTAHKLRIKEKLLAHKAAAQKRKIK